VTAQDFRLEGRLALFHSVAEFGARCAIAASRSSSSD
jgi:hypothetical protein